MKQYKSQSSVLPLEWDTTSSETTVYHNENIVEQPATETTPIMYNYDVTEYTKSEYQDYKIAKLEQLVAQLVVN